MKVYYNVCTLKTTVLRYLFTLQCTLNKKYSIPGWLYFVYSLTNLSSMCAPVLKDLTKRQKDWYKTFIEWYDVEDDM